MTKIYTIFLSATIMFGPLLLIVGLSQIGKIDITETSAYEYEQSIEIYLKTQNEEITEIVTEQKENTVNSVLSNIDEETFVELPFIAGISHNDIPFEGFDIIEEIQTNNEPFFIMYFQDWANSEISLYHLNNVTAEGHIPFISWEPHDFNVPFEQEIYDLEAIAAGTYDNLIKKNLKTIAQHEGIVYIRFAHEFNEGTGWYPWSIGINENTSQQYILAWQHIVNIADSVGADNIRWVWSPNATNFLPKNTLEEAYPGDEYVDFVGIVGYLESNFNTFDIRFNETIEEIRGFTDIPIIITETGAHPDIEERGLIICEYVNDLRSSQEVVGFVWFDKNAREDWRLNEELESFRTSLVSEEC